MEKFIPYEKLSKKEKRKIDQAKRRTWGDLNPVTRKPENSKAYNRNKARNWKREISRDPVPGLLFASLPHSMLSYPYIHLPGRNLSCPFRPSSLICMKRW